MNKKIVNLFKISTLLLSFAFFTMVYPANGQEAKDLCIDMSTAYDQKFKWYNTDGQLPSYVDGHYIFSGGKSSSMYQDALSLMSIRVGESFALSARISVKIDTLSPSRRDEFSIFITDDTRVFTGDEFGFIIRQDVPALLGYLQSPRMMDFFKEFKLESISLGEEKTYTVKAVYSEINGKAIVRFFVNDIQALTYDFPLVAGHEFYLVVSSKKLSSPEIDTSKNSLKVYSACIVNLPVAEIPSTTEIGKTSVESSTQTLINIITMVFSAALLITTINLYIKLRKLTNSFHKK